MLPPRLPPCSTRTHPLIEPRSHATDYLPYQSDPHEPLEILGSSHDLTVTLHNKLVAMHADKLRAAGIDPAAVPPPHTLVLGYWLHAAAETLHPAPEPLSFSTSELPPCVAGMTSAEYGAATRQPPPGRPNR